MKKTKQQYKKIKDAVKLLKQAEKLLLKTSLGRPRCELIDVRYELEYIVKEHREAA